MTEFRDRLHDLGDDPHARRPLEDLDVVLARVHGRRRRRTLALGGVAAVAAVGIWMGGSTLAVGLRQPQVVPGQVTPTATARPTATAGASTAPVVLPTPRSSPGAPGDLCGYPTQWFATRDNAPTATVRTTLLDDEVRSGTAARTLTSVRLVQEGARLEGLTLALALDGVVVATADATELGDGTSDTLVAAWTPAAVCDDGAGSSAGAPLPAGTYQLLVSARLDRETRGDEVVGTLEIVGTAEDVTPAPSSTADPALPPLGWMETVCGQPAPQWPEGSPVRVDATLPEQGITPSPDGWHLPVTVTYTGPGVLSGTARAYATYWLLRDGVVVAGSELGPGDAGLEHVVLPTGLPVPMDVTLASPGDASATCDGNPLPPGDYELTVLYLVLDPTLVQPDGSRFTASSPERVLLTRSAPLAITLAG